MHHYRYDAPEKGRCWGQVVGGGPHMKQEDYPTVIQGTVKGNKLHITVHNVLTGKVQDTFTFKRR
jgi:hypothetical protein